MLTLYLSIWEKERKRERKRGKKERENIWYG